MTNLPSFTHPQVISNKFIFFCGTQKENFLKNLHAVYTVVNTAVILL